MTRAVEAFLALLEELGPAATLPAVELAARLGPDVERALRRASVVRDAGHAEALPCPLDGSCTRELRHAGPLARLPLVAVCGRVPPECEAEPMDAATCALVHVSAAAFVTVLRSLLGLRGSAEPLVLGNHGAARIGEDTGRDGLPRDVLLSVRPNAAELDARIARSVGAARPALLVVPRANRLPETVRAACGPGARLEVAGLDEMLAVRDGVLTRAARPRLVVVPHAPAQTSTSEPTTSHAPLVPTGTRWRDITLEAIDGHVLVIRAGSFRTRRTFQELGFASQRTKQPTLPWQMLIAICEGGGTCRWSDFGQRDALKRLVSTLRDRLREAFGVDEDPFEPYVKGRGGWRPRFAVRVPAAED